MAVLAEKATVKFKELAAETEDPVSGITRASI